MTATPAQHRAKSVYITAAWTIVPVVVLVFLYLRFVADSRTALIASQVLFILAPLGAGAVSLHAAYALPSRSRVRVFWFLFGVTLLMLAASEALYSMLLVWSLDSVRFVATADLLNVLALGSMLAAIGAIVGLDHGGWQRAVGIAIDTAIAVLLGFTSLYTFLLYAGGPTMDVGRLVQSAGYVLAAGVLWTANLAAWRIAGRQQQTAAPALIFASVTLCAVGMLMWPLWEATTVGLDLSSVSVLSGVVWLTGYLLALLAALDRSARRSEVAPPPMSTGVPTVTTPRREAVVAVLALAAVTGAAFGAYRSPHGSSTQVVYLTLLSLGVILMLSRALVASTSEAAALRRETTDELSGTTKPGALNGKLSDLVSASRRYGSSFAVILVDVDDFSRVNSLLGRSAGDRVLSELGGRLAAEFGGTDRVFRFVEDQFAAVAEVDDRSHAARRARDAREAVRVVESGGSLDASVGYAVCPDDALQPDVLLQKADRALAWAKNHGTGLVVGYDERVARAVNTGLLVEEVESATRSELVRTMLAAVDARDRSGFLHSRNVAAITRLFGEHLGLSHGRLERLHVAALLHDVGYLALAVDPMTGTSAARRRSRHEHPMLGARMVESLGIAGAASWVAAHHERWDGHGFPKGLAGDEIPLEARMISLANTYDALVSGRRYGAPMTKSAALQEIDLGIGARFDPDLAERFIELVGSTEALGWGNGGSVA